MFDEILYKTPVSAVRLNTEVPPEFELIIAKAVEEDRDLHYQSVADIRADLKRLKREAGSGNSAAVVSSAAATSPGSSSPSSAIDAAASLSPSTISSASPWNALKLISVAVVVLLVLGIAGRTPSGNRSRSANRNRCALAKYAVSREASGRRLDSDGVR
jgi:hypothetical protein